MFGKSGGKETEALEARVRVLERGLTELRERYAQDLAVLRGQLTAVMYGATLSPEAIRDGIPFGEVAAEEAAAFFQSHPDQVILDVRTDGEWRGGHIPEAVHIDVNELESRLAELPQDKNTPIVCICAMGGRSAAACGMLFEAGYTRLTNVPGGMTHYTGDTVTGD